MYKVDIYLRVRRAVMVEGMSIREAARTFGLHRDTVRKMLAYSVPPGYRRQVSLRRPKLESFTGVIDRILESDLSVPRKQRHTAKRIFERLRDEYGFGGQYTIVKDYVREHRRRSQEMFVPLSHAPGPRPVRLRRGLGDYRRSGTESPLLRPRPAPQRRVLHQGLPWGDHRGLPGRPCVGHRLPGRGAPEHSVRQHQAGGGQDPGRRAGGNAPGPSPSFSPTTCSTTGSGVPARATTRGRWRAWSAICGAIPWCPSRPSRALMR